MMGVVWSRSFILQGSLDTHRRQRAYHQAAGRFSGNSLPFVLVPCQTLRKECFHSAAEGANYLCIDRGFLLFRAMIFLLVLVSIKKEQENEWMLPGASASCRGFQ